jgi:formylglycine-generating enzyme required for sulfatase activity
MTHNIAVLYTNNSRILFFVTLIFVTVSCARTSCIHDDSDMGLQVIKDKNFINSIGMHMVCTSHKYWVSTTEVTEGQYALVLGQNRVPEPSTYTNHVMPDEYARNKSIYPIRYISYEDANEFCNKLTILDGAANNNSVKYIYKIPSWSQWRSYVADATPEDSVLQFDRNIAPIIRCVASKKPNRLGLYDTLGNVTEYCTDWYNQSKKWRMVAGASYLGADRSYWHKDCKGGVTGDKGVQVGFRVIAISVDDDK